MWRVVKGMSCYFWYLGDVFVVYKYRSFLEVGVGGMIIEGRGKFSAC